MSEEEQKNEDGDKQQEGAVNFLAGNGDDPDLYKDESEFNFHQPGRHVDPKCILLDNCSTVDIFCNRKLLSNIRKARAASPFIATLEPKQ